MNYSEELTELSMHRLKPVGGHQAVGAWIVAATLCLSTTSAAVGADKRPWHGEIEAGLVNTTGNTETTSANLNVGLSYEAGAWKHSGKLEALNSSDESGTTAERYLASVKTDYSLSERNYLFGLVKWEKDRFLGYDYQLNEVVGYGRRLMIGEPVQLNAEIGLGARQTKFRQGGSDDEVIVRLAGDFNWNISDTSHLSEALTVEIGDITVTRSVTSLTAKLNSTLAMKLSFIVKNTSEVPAGSDKTDTETAFSLVYGF